MLPKQTRRLSRSVSLPCLFLLLLLQQSQNEQTATSTPIAAPGVIEVFPGESIRRSCTPGQQETFAIVMQPEQLLNFSIIKGDLALTIEAYDPDGTKLLEHVSHNYETIESSLISETAGSYKLVIKSSETSGPDRL